MIKQKSYHLNVYNHCSLACFNCQLDHSSIGSAQDLSSLIEQGLFFSKFPNASIYNIYGGDPVEYPAIELLCKFLHQEGKQIRIWSHLHLNIERALYLRPYVTQWCFFCPSIDAHDYQYHIGSFSFDTALDTLNELKSERITPILHHRITQDNIGFLPFISEFSYTHQLPIWLHFHTKAFSKIQQADILYFEKLKHVSVLPLTAILSTSSCTVPLHPTTNLERLLWKSKLRGQLKQFQKKFI